MRAAGDIKIHRVPCLRLPDVLIGRVLDTDPWEACWVFVADDPEPVQIIRPMRCPCPKEAYR